MPITILRLGHRVFRDQRITSHVFLTARALGATKGYYTGQKDQDLEHSIEQVAKNWGGPFTITYLKNRNEFLKKYKGTIAHLTVYGIPFEKELKKIKRSRNLLIIVGGEKVPPEVYQVGLNLSVGSQPHSEVAALGIFLYELQNRKFKSTFQKSKLKIIPQKIGKKVVSSGKRK